MMFQEKKILIEHLGLTSQFTIHNFDRFTMPSAEDIVTANPLHQQEEGTHVGGELYKRKPRFPSAAFMASLERSRKSSTHMQPADSVEEESTFPG